VMLMFPKPTRRPKRKRPRDEVHLDYVRSLPCCVPGCRSFGESDPHHIRTAATAGTGMKPNDMGHTIPLCHAHHIEHHQIGRHTFARKYSIDLAEIARSLAIRPPADLL
jgi:hypothetical protein